MQNAFRIAFLIIIFLGFSNCRRPVWIPAANESAQRIEDERAYKQDKEADLDIAEDHPDRIFIRAKTDPPGPRISSIPETNLSIAVSKTTCERNSVTVHMWGPADQYDYKYEARVNQIEATLKSIGFKHVYFHLYRCCSHPIFRE